MTYNKKYKTSDIIDDILDTLNDVHKTMKIFFEILQEHGGKISNLEKLINKESEDNYFI